MRLIQLLILSLLALLTSVPAVLWITGSGSGVRLEGVTRRDRAVDLSLKTVLDGTFQRYFERTFLKGSSLYGTLVKGDNQVSLSLFGQASENPKSRVLLGRGGHLLERAYLPAFNRQSVPTKRRLEGIVERLVKLKAALEAQGKVFVLLITTNKPNFYPELVPERYRVPHAQERAGGYEVFRQLLKERGVEPFDSRTFLRQLQKEVDLPLFAPTGTHWSQYAACRVAAALTAQIAQALRRPLNQFSCELKGSPQEPSEQDQDLLKIANLLFPKGLLQRVPVVAVEVPRAVEPSQRPRLLIIGTSFCWELFRSLDRARVFAHRDFLYYFKRLVTYPQGKRRPFTEEDLDIEKLVSLSDVVVVEVNEAFVHRTGYGFLEWFFERNR